MSAYLIQLPSLSRSWKNCCSSCELLSFPLRLVAKSFSLRIQTCQGKEEVEREWGGEEGRRKEMKQRWVNKAKCSLRTYTSQHPIAMVLLVGEGGGGGGGGEGEGRGMQCNMFALTWHSEC